MTDILLGPTITEPSRRRRPSVWVRRVVLAGALLGVLLVVLAAWLAWRGVQARDALQAARPVAVRIQQQVLDGDADASRSDLSELQGHTRDARDATHDPVWDAATRLPGVGDDVRVVQQTTALLDDVARRALPPLVDAAGSLDPEALRPVDSTIDLAPLREAEPALRQAHTQMTEARDRAAAIDTEGVDPRIAEPAADLQELLAAAVRTTSTGVRAAALLPSMLGADGPRTYLLLVQSNAEARALGGAVGATALVRADGGRIELVEQVPAGDLDDSADPALPLTQEQRRLFGDDLGRSMEGVTQVPSFDTTAQLAREIYRRETGTAVDGVIATDPVAVSYLLRATGPVPLATGGQLTAGNAVEMLLSQVYARFPKQAEQDDVFAAAAGSVFEAVTAGSAEPAALLNQLAKAAGERRTLVWSLDPGEQVLLSGTVLAGELPTGRDGRPAVGVYLNDATDAKMGYYLRHSVSLQPVCDASVPTYTVQVRLTSTAPADAASTLPQPVLGDPADDVPAGSVRTDVLVYGPRGGTVTAVRRDGQPVGTAALPDQDRSVGVATVDLAPGQEAVIEADVALPPGSDRSPLLRTTPGVVEADLLRVKPVPCELN